MRSRFLVTCALSLPFLAICGQGLMAQDVWPPDDDAAPPQQTYTHPAYEQQPYSAPGESQQSYPQQYPQQAYGNQPYGDQAYGQAPYDQGLAPASGMQPISPGQLEQLVAPIALYPDQLLAQILTASTYPAQISAADQWMRSMGNAAPEQIAAGASAQTAWDPSVKAMTAYPSVLQMLASNLQWATSLGNAYYNQPQDVLQMVQVLRGRAEQAGNLRDTPQEQVVQNQGYISVAPTNPEVVYVPTYNPWVVYGAPVAPYPGFYAGVELGDAVGAAVEFGVGFAVDAFIRAPLGMLAWGLDWIGGAVLFHDSFCWSHSYEMDDWGFERGGPRFRGGWGGGSWGERGGTQMARFGDYNHQAIPVHGAFPHANPGAGGRNGFGQNGFNRAGGNFPTARPGGGMGGQNGLGQKGFNRNENGQNGFNRAGGQFPGARPGGGAGGGFGQNGSRSGLNQAGGGFPTARPGGGMGGQNGLGQNGFNRGPQQAFNHMPAPGGRPQTFGGVTPARPGYGGQSTYGGSRGFGGSNYAGGSTYAGRGSYPGGSSYAGGGQGFVGRQGGGYGIPRYNAPTQSYRAPQQNFGGYSRGPSQAYAGGYGGLSHGASPYGGSLGGGRAPSYSGGHAGGMFGGGHSQSFDGGHAQSFGGGHSGGFFGGGHSQSFGGGHAQSFGGGGHSGGFFGGGHSGGSFGGGHSSSHSFGGGGHEGGGGHSSGGHSGGGHSRR